jgi:hypothetical protein
MTERPTPLQTLDYATPALEPQSDPRSLNMLLTFGSVRAFWSLILLTLWVCVVALGY